MLYSRIWHLLHSCYSILPRKSKLSHPGSSVSFYIRSHLPSCQFLPHLFYGYTLLWLFLMTHFILAWGRDRYKNVKEAFSFSWRELKKKKKKLGTWKSRLLIFRLTSPASNWKCLGTPHSTVSTLRIPIPGGYNLTYLTRRYMDRAKRDLY